MERLTNANEWSDKIDLTKELGYSHIWKRLKEYEDLIGIDHLRELIEAEKDGRLVVLPCKVGDKIWKTKTLFSNYAEPKQETVCGFAYPWHDPSGDELLICCNGGYKFSENQLGDTIFLTREQAAAALRGEEQ